MILQVREFVQAQGLLREWVVRTLRARYQQSLLGWLWAFIQPATQAAVYTVVFTRLVPVDTGGPPYAAFAYVATASWAFLAASLTDMTNSLVDNMSLVNKIYFPREVLPAACMLARLVDLGIAAALFVGVAVYFGLPSSPATLPMLLIVLLLQLLLISGLGLATAALNVFVRDVRSVLVLVLQVWLYASPVIYPVEAVPDRYRAVYSLNPMVGIIEGYRAVLLKGSVPSPELLLPAAAVAVASFVCGYWLFKRLEFRFADIV
jgi:lipopolysaccharide transport system permease protein